MHKSVVPLNGVACDGECYSTATQRLLNSCVPESSVSAQFGGCPKLLVQVVMGHLRAAPRLLPDLLYSLFDIVLFDDCFNQWSLSRPMLSLILVITMIDEQEMSNLTACLIASQPHEKQEYLAQCLDKLMKDVDATLESKNRDRFTQNLSPVRHEFKTRNWA